MYRYLTTAILVLSGPVLSGPALAAHPLPVDDAGTVDAGAWQLEVAFSRVDVDPGIGPSNGYSVAARRGLFRDLDAGLAVLLSGESTPGQDWETVIDLKWAPGRTEGWRPRPFVRSDIAFAEQVAQEDARRVGMAGGLTWEQSSAVVTAEFGTFDVQTGGDWAAAAGIYYRIRSGLWLAAGWIQSDLSDGSSDAASLGMLIGLGPGDLSIGVEFAAPNRGLDDSMLLLGWTGTFSR